MIFNKKTFPNVGTDRLDQKIISFTETGVIRFTKPCYRFFDTGAMGRLWFRLKVENGKPFIIAGKADDAFGIKITTSTCDMKHVTMVSEFLKAVGVEKKGVAKFELGPKTDGSVGGYAVYEMKFMGNFPMRHQLEK